MCILHLVGQRLRDKEQLLLSCSDTRGWKVPIGSTR